MFWIPFASLFGALLSDHRQERFGVGYNSKLGGRAKLASDPVWWPTRRRGPGVPALRRVETPVGVVTEAMWPDAAGVYPEWEPSTSGFQFWWRAPGAVQKVDAVYVIRQDLENTWWKPSYGDYIYGPRSLPYSYTVFHPDAPPSGCEGWRTAR